MIWSEFIAEYVFLLLQENGTAKLEYTTIGIWS